MPNKNYMLTIAAENMYLAARRLLSALESMSYQDSETSKWIYNLRNACDQYAGVKS